MKDRIIFFVVGLLLGAIISTGSIYFYTLAECSDESFSQQNMQMPGGGGTPPSDMNGDTPPEMPGNNNQQN